MLIGITRLSSITVTKLISLRVKSRLFDERPTKLTK
jgi:hypothetical protein